MSTSNEVSMPLKVSIAAIVAAWRAGTIIRAPGNTPAQLNALQAHIDAVDAMLREEFGNDNVAPFIQRALTTTPKLPPGNPAAAAISLAGAMMRIDAARRHFDKVGARDDDRFAILELSFGHADLIRYVAQMDETSREHLCAVLESLVNYRGTNSLVADPTADPETSA